MCVGELSMCLMRKIIKLDREFSLRKKLLKRLLKEEKEILKELQETSKEQLLKVK